MEEEKDIFYTITVSSLQLRRIPSEQSKVNLSKGTVVKFTGNKKRYNKEDWISVRTVSDPIVSGFINKKYTEKI